jgi:inosine-uridine nucleoside N-ribohydrolase
MRKFPALSRAFLLQRLEPPSGPVSMVLDTDTYNEIDDQFALVYSLLSPNLTVEAVYAAPFHNKRSSGPGDGMVKSYEEILRLLERLDHPHEGFAFRGSESYLPDGTHPVRSAAVEDLIKKALAPREGPLYVLPIGAITNVASAILMAPEIIEKIVVVWLGGQPYYWPSAQEFNLGQDVPASQLIFDCGVPLVHIPCKNVAEHLRTTLPEMAHYVKGRGRIGDYLYQIYEEHFTNHYARSKVLWDISTIAYLNNPAWTPSAVVPSPILKNDVTWAADSSRHPTRVVTDVRRDEVYGDLFRKLEQRAAKETTG